MKDFYLVHEAAEALGVSEQTFKRWIRQKKITITPQKRGGGQGNPYLYAAEDIQRLIISREESRVYDKDHH